LTNRKLVSLLNPLYAFVGFSFALRLRRAGAAPGRLSFDPLYALMVIVVLELPYLIFYPRRHLESVVAAIAELSSRALMGTGSSGLASGDAVGSDHAWC